MGRRLWAPMFAMSLMAWPVAFVLAAVRASEIAGSNPDQILIARLGQYVPAVMFIGFLSVFAAISFSITRALLSLVLPDGAAKSPVVGLVLHRRIGVLESRHLPL